MLRNGEELEHEHEPVLKRFRASTVENTRVMQRMRIVEGTMNIIQQKLKILETNILNNVNSSIEQAVVNALKKVSTASFPIELHQNNMATDEITCADTSTPANNESSTSSTIPATETTSSNQNWQIVSNKKSLFNFCVKDSQSQNLKSQPGTSNNNNNMFDVLSIGMEDDQVPSLKPDLNKPKITHRSDNLKNRNSRFSKTKSLKATPIIAYNVNHKALLGKLKEENKTDFEILKGRNPDRSVILPISKESRAVTLSILKEKNIPHFTFTPKEEKNTSLLLKNVPEEYDLQDVIEELKTLEYYNKIAKVSQLNKGKLARYKFYIISVLPGQPIGEFLKLDLLFHTRVRIEKFINKDEPQCFKCQRLGHMAKGCEMGLKCVKCAQAHTSEQCPIPKDSPKEMLKCAHCEGNHAASYRGCPKIKELLKRKKLNSAQAQPAEPKNIITKPSFVKNNVSFASALGNNNDMSLKGINALLNSASEELFGCNYTSLKIQFDKFLEIYKGNDNLNVRKEALLNFIMSTNYNG